MTVPSTEAFAFRVVRALRIPKSRQIRIGAAILMVFILGAVFAPILSTHPPNQTVLSNALKQPSSDHWLGTDEYGRDVYSRLLYGARVSLTVAVTVVMGSLVAGGLIGLVAGYVGGVVERVLMALNDILLAFPGFLLALAIVAVRGSSLSSVILAIGVAYTPRVAVVMRSVVITLRERLYVKAARSSGIPTWRVIVIHVLPNSLAPILVVAAISAATAVLAEAGLSFLGVGVQPPTATWGNVIADGQSYLRTNPLISISGGLAVSAVVVALNLVGEGLRDFVDPRVRTSEASIS